MTKLNDIKACSVATFDLHHHRRCQSSPSIVVNIIIINIITIIYTEEHNDDNIHLPMSQKNIYMNTII